MDLLRNVIERRGHQGAATRSGRTKCRRISSCICIILIGNTRSSGAFFFSSAYFAGGAAAWQPGDVIFGSDGGGGGSGGGGGCINFLLPTEEKSKGVTSTGVTRSYARRRTGE